MALPGWQELIVCDPAKTMVDVDCGFPQLIQLAQNLVTDLILVSSLLAGAVFAYAGLKLMTSGGNESVMKEAKAMLWKVLIGYLWILGAWLLIYTISSVLLADGFSLLIGSPQ